MLLAFVVLAVLAVMPAETLVVPHDRYLTLHTVLELTSVVVAALVFGVAWNAYAPERPATVLVLALALLGSGLLDLGHALSFPGMPDADLADAPQQTIVFWLSARLVAALGLLAVSLRRWRPITARRERLQLLAATLLATGALGVLGAFGAHALPATFVPGRGLTGFKIGAELALVAVYLAAAALLARRARAGPGEMDFGGLAAAAALSAASGLCFVLYVQVNDAYNLLGHVYKIAAYVLIYRVVFIGTVRAPFVQLLASRQALARERERFDLALRATSDGLWECDLAIDRCFISRRFKELLGFDGGEGFMDRAAFFALVHPQDLDRLQRALDDHLARRTPFDVEVRVAVRRQGHRWFRVRGQAVWDAAGVPLRVAGSILDVTDRRDAEAQLHLTAKVFESSSEAIVIVDQRRRIVSVNPAFTKITGYAPEEVIGRYPKIVDAGTQDRRELRRRWSAIKRDGHWEGEVKDRRRDGTGFAKWLRVRAVRDADGNISHYIGVFSDVSERKAAQKRIEFLAYYDPLTSLPNRTLFRDRVSRAIAVAQRHQGRLALLFIDLDRFKNVNDSLGHTAGDRLLRTVADRLQGLVRDADTVARLSGDEFVVLLTEVNGPDGAAVVAQRILHAISAPHVLGGTEVAVTPSIGISVYPEDGADHDELIQHADIAMYHAKETGRANFQFFRAELNERVLERISLENSLRRALENEEFLLHYQPQVSLEDGHVVGFEALIRWHQPGQGMVPPGRFIPVAEDSGLIVPIGAWVLRSACRQCRQWQEAGSAPVPVAVNISAVQFRQPDFVDTVREALAGTALDPEFLELEFTESVVMDRSEQVLRKLRQLRALGVQVSIDDFGTGYSSLSYLRQFPIDKLKIDQSFTRDLGSGADSQPIVSAIIAMARSLGLEVIAEGVETRAQLELLRRHGCGQGQGYLFARPMPADAARDTIGRRYPVAGDTNAALA
ncbi:MAG: bifunctional diguanylate cyclase/phosphodiesterase [Pseudomonadota bacterium]